MKQVEEFESILKKLDQATLIKLMCEYDEYIHTVLEHTDGDCCPSLDTLEEFFHDGFVHTVHPKVIYRLFVDVGH